jgi:hypothetical protein
MKYIAAPENLGRISRELWGQLVDRPCEEE